MAMGQFVDGLRALTPSNGFWRLRGGWMGSGADILQEAPKTRVRRGKVVAIPEKWRGKTIHPQQIRKRKEEAKLKHKNGRGEAWSRQSGRMNARGRRAAQREREEVRQEMVGE